MREIKFSYIYQHDDTGRILNKKFDIHEIELELMGECFIERYTLIARRQYTGFEIKNIEIYENDIIRARKDYLYKVVFENGSFVLYHLNKYDGQELICWGLLRRFFDSDMKDILEESEIIGNIYENPEMLELE